MLIVTPTKGKPGQPSGQPSRGYGPAMQKVCRTADLESGGRYGKQVRRSAVTAQLVGDCFGPVTDPWRGSSDESTVDEAGSTPVSVGCPSSVAQGTGRPGTPTGGVGGRRADRAR